MTNSIRRCLLIVAVACMAWSASRGASETELKDQLTEARARAVRTVSRLMCTARPAPAWSFTDAMIALERSSSVAGDSLTSRGPVTLRETSGVVLRRLRIQGAPGNCIELHGCSDVTIDECALGPAGGEGVHLVGCTSITVTRSCMAGIRSGVYAVSCSGINVTDNVLRNVKGPMPRGQFVQFDKVTGPRNRICDNWGENIMGESQPEDAISLYMSSGTVEDPIQVKHNVIKGGGPSTSGGGIMTGDNGSAHIVVEGNVLLDPGQYGIAVAGGNHIRILGNVVVARSQPFTNVGLYVWNQTSAPCGSIEVRGNRVCWLNKEGKPGSAWNAGNCSEVTGWNDNEWDAQDTSTTLAMQWGP